MVLDDICYDLGDTFLLELNRGNIGTVIDITTESNTSTGILCVELPLITGTGGGEISYIF